MSELVMKYQQYVEYKDSGVEWLGEIPKNWEVVRLKYIAELSGNKVSGSENQYVGLENVESKTGKFKVTEGIVSEGVSNTFEKDNLLFGKLRPYLAKSWLASFSGICSSEFLVLNSQLVHPKFLKYMTLTDEFVEQVNSSTYGSKMPRASWDFIGLLQLPVMDYGVSETIANFLDFETAQIDTLIEKQQTLIQLLKEKRQAVISHAVTKGLNPDALMKDSGVEWLGDVPEHWTVKRLKYISPKVGVGLVINPSTYTQDEGVYFIFGGDVKEFSFDLTKTRRISQKNSDILKPSQLHHRDLVSIRVGYPGVTAVVTEELEGANCASIIIIRRGQFNSDWLCAAMNIWVGKQQVNNASYGAAQKQFNVSDAIEFIFPVPPESEQNDIAVYVEESLNKFDELSNKAQLQIELLRERRTALISAAVTGKIDVRGWRVPD